MTHSPSPSSISTAAPRQGVKRQFNWFGRCVVLMVVASVPFGQCAWAANTGDAFNTGATDLSVTGNYASAPSSTKDIQFTGNYAGTNFTVNGASLTYGTLNDLDITQSLVITNSNATAGSITLSTAANSTSGSTAADLLFVKSGANLTLQSGAGTLTLNFGVSGNVDDAGTLSLAGPIGIGTTTVTFTGNGATTVSGNIGATAGLITVNDGTGSVTLSGNNAYTGATTLTAGTLNLTGTQTASAVAINGGTFNESSTGVISGGVAYTQANGTSTLSGKNTYTGATTLTAGTLNLTGTQTASAVAINGGTFNESSTGVISGAVAYTQTSGTSTLSGKNISTGATTVNGGVLNLNFGGAGAPVTNIINNAANSSALTLGGGTLLITGGSGLSNSQRFNGLTLTTLTASKVNFVQNGATSLTGSFGAITRGAASTVDFTLPTSGSATTTSATFVTNGVLTSAAPSTGIAFATVNGGTAFATLTSGSFGALNPTGSYGATGNVSVGTSDAPASGLGGNTLTFNGAADSVAFTGTNAITTGGILVTPSATGVSSISGGALTAGGGKELVIFNNAPAVSGSLVISSVIADSAAGASALTVTGSGVTVLSAANTFTGNTTITNSSGLQLGNANALQNSSLVFSTGTSAGLTFASGIGTFTVGGLTGSTNGANILTLVDTAAAPVNLQVGNNNANTTFNSGISSGTLTKIGTGTLFLNGGSNITSSVVVNNGTVFSSGVAPLQNVPSLTINNGGIVAYQRGSVNIAGGAAADTITINSGGILSSDYVTNGGSQDVATAQIVLNGGTLATRNQPTTGTDIIYDRGSIGLGNAATAGTAAVTAGGGTNPTSTISAVNASLRESGGTIFNVAAGSGTGGSASPTGGVDLLFSGTILSRTNNNNGTLIKQGNGVMELTGANAFITPVQISAGILQINSIANGGVQTTTSAAAPSGSTSATVTSANGIAAGEAVGFSSSSNTINAGTTVGSGYTAGSTTVPLAVPTNTTDTGTVTLASGFALTFGFANPLGISTNAASNLILNGGTLQYVGTTAGSTDRLFQIGASADTVATTATIDSSGAGSNTLSFTNAGALTYGKANLADTLILTGSNTGANTFNPVLGNNGTAAVNLTKNGPGTWVLSGSSTYTGVTTVNQGTLQLGHTGTIGAANGGTLGGTAVTVNTGGTLLLGASQTVGTNTSLTLAGGTLQNGGAFSEGSGASVVNGGTPVGTNAAGAGNLTLSTASTLDFGSGTGTLVFNSLSDSGGFTLTVQNYVNNNFNNGTTTSGVDGTDDRLIFANDPSAFLSDINFGSGTTATEISLGGGYFEVGISAVPEPTTIFAGLLVLGLVGYRERRRIAGLVSSILVA